MRQHPGCSLIHESLQPRAALFAPKANGATVAAGLRAYGLEVLIPLPTGRCFPDQDPVLKTPVVPNYRCGTAPELAQASEPTPHRIPF